MHNLYTSCTIHDILYIICVYVHCTLHNIQLRYASTYNCFQELRDARLVSDETVSSPWTLIVYCNAETFDVDQVTKIALEIEGDGKRLAEKLRDELKGD